MAKGMCQGGALLNIMKGIRTWTEKKEFLEQAIVDCSPKPKKCPTRRKKKERVEGEIVQMSGWACAMKKCALDSNGMTMSNCTQNPTVKQNYYDNKGKFTQMGKAGCL